MILPFTIYLVRRTRPLSIAMQEGYMSQSMDVAIVPYLVSFPSSWFFIAGSTTGIVSACLITLEIAGIKRYRLFLAAHPLLLVKGHLVTHEMGQSVVYHVIRFIA